MGIDNDDFAQVAWFREDLFPIHPFYYLDLLGRLRACGLIPSNVAEKLSSSSRAI